MHTLHVLNLNRGLRLFSVALTVKLIEKKQPQETETRQIVNAR